MVTAVISLGGVDITSNVLFPTAYFMSAVNGIAGEARFRIRDEGGTLSPVVGSEVTLTIDGDPVWTGFLSQSRLIYVFPALNVVDFGPTRFVDAVCVDINVLFAKRIAFKQSAPEDILAPLYGPHTADTAAISDLVSDWLDLSGDGLDTSSGVVGVGDINEDQNARAWSGSDTWGQAMNSIALLPGAIFYLRPNKELAYVDTDTPDAPFGLSDAPNGTTKRGYREMEVLFDGTNLANDVMCWGAGYGSSVPVFDRDEDATSISDHGRWQLGQVTFGVYKQATIERITDSIINGSPDHHRGAKDDRKAVTLTTYEPGLLPAQKVNFESTVFGYSDVLPIRKMEVTFEAPDNPKYALTLSQEIDTPWSFFDPWKFRLPNLPGFQIPPFPPIITPEVPGGCECSITDIFERTVSAGWGVSTSGLPWTYTPDGAADASVDGIRGVLLAVAGDSPAVALPAVTLTTDSLEVRFQFETSEVSAENLDKTYFSIGQREVRLDYGTGSHSLPGSQPELRVFSPSANAAVKIGYTAGVIYNVAFLVHPGTQVSAKIWADGSTEPGSWDVTAGDSGTFPTGQPQFSVDSDGTNHVYIDNLDIPTINRCTENRFDNFDRTVSGGFGTSSSGYLYDSSPGAGSMGADGSAGYVNFSGGDTATAEIDADGPWRTATGFVMTTRVQATTLPPIGQKVVTEIGTFHDSFGLFDGVDLTLTTDNPVPPADSTLGLWHNGIQPDQLASPPTLIYFTGQTGWYNIKWEYRPPLTRVRLWHESDPEPTTWDIEVSDAVHNGDETFWSSFSHTGAGSTTTLLDYINFDYAGKPCYIDGPPPAPPSPGGPAFGPICEVATRTDSTHYQLSRSFIHLSEQVYVGTPGLLVRPGITLEYTTDPEAGIIIFNDAVTDGTRIYVCYTAIGPVT